MPFATGGGGAVKKLASGSIAGLTQANPVDIDFRNYASNGQFTSLEMVMSNRVSSGNIGTGVTINFQLLVAGVAGATAYGRVPKGVFTGSTFADTSVTLMDNPNTVTVTRGGAILRMENMFVNASPWGNFDEWTKMASQYSGGAYTYFRDVVAIHDGIRFLVPSADADTQSFDWVLWGIQ